MLLKIENFGGHFHCKSKHNTSFVTVDRFNATFESGVTVLRGDIDSAGWALCYALNFATADKDSFIDEDTAVYLDGTRYALEAFSKRAGYIDLYGYDSRKDDRMAVRQHIERALCESDLNFTVDDIKTAFQLTDSRFQRPLTENGNEALRAAAAIEFAKGKDLFCFPWFSAKMLCYYAEHIRMICDFLSQQGKITLLPTSYVNQIDNYRVLDLSDTHVFGA